MKKVYAFLCAGLLICLPAAYIQAQGGDPMKLASPAFAHNQPMPARFSCQGDDINPQLEISGVPEHAQSLVLIMDDPDAPGATWDHWIVYNIPVDTELIEENSAPGIQGTNSWGRRDYGGPCPPSGTHRYFFKLYALDTGLELSDEADKQDLENAMKGHILAQTELIGLYKRR